jgi:hypothetical protein
LEGARGPTRLGGAGGALGRADRLEGGADGGRFEGIDSGRRSRLSNTLRSLPASLDMSELLADCAVVCSAVHGTIHAVVGVRLRHPKHPGPNPCHARFRPAPVSAVWDTAKFGFYSKESRTSRAVP